MMGMEIRGKLHSESVLVKADCLKQGVTESKDSESVKRTKPNHPPRVTGRVTIIKNAVPAD